MDENKWLALCYTLPREPSRARVSIWRKLKKLGAVGIWQSMWILPRSDKNSALLCGVKDEVVMSGGEAFMFALSADGDGEKLLAEKFAAARNEEYGELFERCGDFFAEIDKEIGRRNFTFAEIEENEEELEKLRQWYEKIAARDTPASALGEKARSMLAKCKELLDDFGDRVYAFAEMNGENRGESK